MLIIGHKTKRGSGHEDKQAKKGVFVTRCLITLLKDLQDNSKSTDVGSIELDIVMSFLVFKIIHWVAHVTNYFWSSCISIRIY